MARKRSNGEGSVFYNESRSRWEAKLYVVEPDGRRRRKTLTAKTRKAVTARLAEVQAAVDQGLQIPDPTTTVSDYAAWWAEHVLPGEGLAPATERWYRDILASYLRPRLGAKTLTGPRALTPSDVEAIGVKLEQDGYSHRVADATRTTLGKILRDAQQRGLITRNVARLAKPPKDRGRARKIKALTAQQITTLLGNLDGTWRTVTVVAVTTGLRPGEVLGLCWPDVHLDGEPYVSVRQALSHATGQPTLKAPKRARSHRTVPLAPEAVVELRSWRKVQAAERLAAGAHWSSDLGNLTFTGTDGRPLRVDSWRHAMSRAQPGTTPHRCRHSYATALLEAGTPIHHVAELLGDAVATVESHYSHVLRTKTETAAVASQLLGWST